MCPFGSQCSTYLGQVDIVEAAHDGKKERRNFEVQPLEEADFMGKRHGATKDEEAWEETGTIGVEEAAGPGVEGEARGSHPLSHIGEGF